MLEDPNEKVVVACGHEKFNFKASQIGRYNASYGEKVLAKLFIITITGSTLLSLRSARTWST